MQQKKERNDPKTTPKLSLQKDRFSFLDRFWVVFCINQYQGQYLTQSLRTANFKN